MILHDCIADVGWHQSEACAPWRELLSVLCFQAWWISPGRPWNFSMRRTVASQETFIFPPLRTLKMKPASSQLTKFEKVVICLLPPSPMKFHRNKQVHFPRSEPSSRWLSWVASSRTYQVGPSNAHVGHKKVLAFLGCSHVPTVYWHKQLRQSQEYKEGTEPVLRFLAQSWLLCH